MTDERLSGALQENILTLLVFDDVNCKLARSALTPQLFESSIFREIAGIAISFIDQYGAPVKEHLPDHLEDILKGDDQRKAASYKRLLDNLFLSKDSLNSQYVLSQLQKFVRAQTLKSGLVEAVEAMEDNDIVAAELAMQKALTKQITTFSAGINLSDPTQITELLSSDPSEPGFHIGIPEIDDRGAYPRRKALAMMLAPRGRGKSWFVIHCAKMALLQRWKVLIITLEMSAKSYAARTVQALQSVSRHQSEARVAQLIRDRDGNLEDVMYEELERLTLKSDADRKKITERMIRDSKRRVPFYIKEFPMSKATLADVEAHLDGLERYNNFIPDVVFLDYPDLLKHDVKNKRVEIGNLYEGFRGIMVARNMAGVVVSQGNRDSESATTVTGDQASEDISKLATVDLCYTLSRTLMEEHLGLARVLVEKARDQQDGFSVLITQAYGLGQWCLDSVLLRSNDYWELMKDKEKSNRPRHQTEDAEPEERTPARKTVKRPARRQA